MDSKDPKMLVEYGLGNNAKVRALVRAYEELTEMDKELFRLAAGIGQDVTTNGRGRQRKRDAEPGSWGEPSEVQTLVRSLMRTLLEDYPTLLTDADISNLMNRDYCKSTLGIRIGNHPILRRLEQGSKDASGYGRYYVDPYAAKFYVCSQWWKDYHLSNAKSLLRFVTDLIQRKHDHPGVPALERHQQALEDYIRQPGAARISL